MTASSRDCVIPGNKVHWQDRREIGMMVRFWEFSTMKCCRCGTTWLRAFLEMLTHPRPTTNFALRPWRHLTGLVAGMALSLAACTTEAWYEGMKARARNECHQQPPAERQRCLQNVNQKSYDDYEKERAAKKGPEP